MIDYPHKNYSERGFGYNVQLIKNNYGKLGDIGTEVFHPRNGKGMVFDKDGNIRWRDSTFNSNYRVTNHPSRPYNEAFDRILLPVFSKDVEKLKKYNYDIRQILADNSIR